MQPESDDGRELHGGRRPKSGVVLFTTDFGLRRIKKEMHSWDVSLRDFFKSCIALRKAYPALRRGEFLTLFAQDQRYAYMRRLGGETLVVALNNGPRTWQMDINLGESSFSGLQSHTLLGAGQAHIQGSRITGMTLAPRSGNVLRLA